MLEVLYEIRGCVDGFAAYRRASLQQLKELGFSFDEAKAKNLNVGQDLYAMFGPDRFVLVRIT